MNYGIIKNGLALIGMLLLGGCGSSDDDQPPETYRVGGTVSGLKGSLILSDSYGNHPVNADGRFQFPHEYPDQSPLELTIAQQPLGQWCELEISQYVINGSDISDIEVWCASTMERVGQYGVGRPIALTASGKKVYLASDQGVLITDFTNPAAPKRAGYYHVTDSGSVSDIAVSGDLVFVADWHGGLHIIDASDPLSPQKLSVFNDAPGSGIQFITLRGVTVAGNHAYLSLGFEGLVVLDISSPEHPSLISRIFLEDSTNEPKKVIVSGDRLFVLTEKKLFEVDIKDHALPRIIGQYEKPGWLLTDFAMAGEHLYLTARNNSSNENAIQILNVSVRGNILATTSLGMEAYPVSIDATAHDIFVNTINAVTRFDISNPVAPVAVGVPSAPTFALAIEGDDLYRIRWPEDNVNPVVVIASHKLSNPIPFIEVGNLEIPPLDYITGIDVVDKVAHVSDWSGGFQIIDFSEIDKPKMLGSLPGEYFDLEVEGGHAYLVGSGGLDIVDIRTPTAPTKAGSLAGEGAFDEVTVSGSLAFVRKGTDDLYRIVDVANPERPEMIPGPSIPGQSLVVRGQYAYALNGNLVAMFDISRPEMPQLRGTTQLAGYGWGLALSDSGLTVARSSGLDLLDISDPAHAVTVGNHQNDLGNAIAATATHVFAFSPPLSLAAFDVSNPARPVHVASLPTRFSGGSLAIDGNYVYYEEFGFGLKVAKLRND